MKADPPHLRRGRAAEDAALAHLRARGLVLVARNVRYPWGELDLVMRDGASLVFVEVKSRARSVRWGGAAAALGPQKARRLARAAQTWLQARHGNRLPPCRFDAVLIEDDAPLVWLRDVLEFQG